MKEFISLGVPSLAINEDTTHSEVIWKVTVSYIFLQNDMFKKDYSKSWMAGFPISLFSLNNSKCTKDTYHD